MKLSQEQLAKQIGISVPHMSNIENGKAKFSLQVLVDLADALEITLCMLLYGQEDSSVAVCEMIMEEIDRQLSGGVQSCR